MLICLAAALVLVAILWEVLWAGPTEPIYQGTRLSAWLDGTKELKGAPWEQFREIAKSIGPEALPWLIWALPHYDRQSRLWLHYAHLYLQSGFAQHFLPAPSKPSAQIATMNTVAMLAILAPGTRYETNAVDVLLRMDQSTTSWGWQLENARIEALGYCTNCEDRVLPTLLQSVTNAITLNISIFGLQHFGDHAIAHLYQMALTETGAFRPAEQALAKIDSGAYLRLQTERKKGKLQ